MTEQHPVVKLRRQQCLTQAALAMQAGVSTQTISNLENGKHHKGQIRLETAQNLSSVLGVPTLELMEKCLKYNGGDANATH